ncbi:MAG: helix-turn-helix transcriptional regulator, partial [Pseudobutyrivibrio sp.]|nr:helix-turn-helix transcriptional regulator [Pseudobutyrivibrio sp.]
MQQHYTQISLPQLAEFFGYSERQTRRLLLKFTGKGYQENLDFIRMKEAERLLNNSDKSIEEIGSTVGFSSVYSFRKNFKNYYGITPSEYRNQKITSTF